MFYCISYRYSAIKAKRYNITLTFYTPSDNRIICVKLLLSSVYDDTVVLVDVISKASPYIDMII